MTGKLPPVCPHLAPLEAALRAAGIETEWNGLSWYRSRSDTSPGGRWIYIKCFLDRRALERRLGLQEPVRYLEYDGRVMGQEAGFYCKEHDSAVVGVHRAYAGGLPRFR